MKKIIFLFSCVILPLSATISAMAQDIPVFGYLERTHVGPKSLVLIAKLDTGADTSSLGYFELKKFERDGRPWVRFTVLDEGRKLHSFERPVVRVAKIKRRRGLKPLERPVVEMRVCLGGVERLTPVNLADRQNFSTQLLLGRSFLARAALVHSGKALTSEPECGKAAGK